MAGFLAIKTEENNCALVDPVTGAELAVTRAQPSCPFAFDSSGELLTYGSGGVCRWPVRTDPETARLCVGPPECLFPVKTEDGHGSSTDGQVLAIPNYQRGAHYCAGPPGAPIELGPQEDVRSCGVSPDGRGSLPATTQHAGRGRQVWDATYGHLVKDLPMSTGCRVAFSPDGKWLLAVGDECELWEVGTWEKKALGKGNGFVFTRDCRMVAIGGDAGMVRLVDPLNGREYVRLDASQQTSIEPYSFTPDGGQLIAFAFDSQVLCIWDLRAIRRGLKALDLDWDAPDILPSRPRVRRRCGLK